MKKEEEFKKDILKVTKAQDEKIDKVLEIAQKNSETLESIVNITEEPKEDPMYIGFGVPLGAVDNEEFKQRTQKVLELIKPVLVKYEMAHFSTFKVDKKNGS